MRTAGLLIAFAGICLVFLGQPDERFAPAHWLSAKAHLAGKDPSGVVRYSGRGHLGLLMLSQQLLQLRLDRA